MSSMFGGTYALTNIDALANWNTGSVTNMSSMFSSARSLTNIDALANWNTGSVTNMSSMFSSAVALVSIDALANWDTGSVINMNWMFGYTSSLTNIDGASSWDTSNVTNMRYTFYYASSLVSIDALANWDTSSVTDMNDMFGGTYALTNIDGASSWDVSNVTNMSYMFSYAKSLTNIDALANWDVSSVTNMYNMFEWASSLTNIDGASNWDTSNVTNMSYMFSYADALTNTSGADNWDIRNVTAIAGSSSSSSNNFYRIFYHAGSSSSPYHPNFTKRSGTWNGDGTFIPDDTISSTAITTINFDSHISNIKFYGKFPGSSSSTTQTISTSGSTISLNRGDSYQITATLSSGYELALWDPGEHGVIPPKRLNLNSRTEDYTNFTPIGDTTLTATSQPVPSDVTTTVNIDSNIKQVFFCNDKYNTYNSSTRTYDCAIATTNASTVTLKQGVTYRVTTVTNSGYEVSSYTTTGATITSTTGPHTYFTPSGNSTLTITSTASAPTHTVAVNMDSNVSYVTFTNPDWPTRTAIRNGSTVDLRENTPYTATAYTKNGYRLSTWSTTSGGTLNSTTTNPATYTITDDATLTVTSETVPSHQVIVNMDSNTTSVSFYNANYGVQTATSANPNVSLREDIEYIITGTYVSGYEFASWATTADGTLGDATSATTTYTVINTATLSLTSQEGPPDPPTSCTTPVPNLTYMQDITSSNRATVLASLTEEAPYYLRDSRDGEPYCVSKLKDGNLWLLDNLRLDLTDSDVLNNTTASNTNASATSLGYLKNGGGSSDSSSPLYKYAITGVVEWTDSQTYASSYSYSDPLIATSYKDTINSNTSYNYGNGSHKYGIYYNYCAASAGSYCYGNGTSAGTSSGNATEDLCPAGWRMPTGGSSGEYNSLYGYYNTTQTATNTASLQYNLSTPLSGYFDSGSAYSQGSNGYFWSSTRYNVNLMYDLYVGSGSVYPTISSYRYYGISMRCLLDS